MSIKRITCLYSHLKQLVLSWTKYSLNINWCSKLSNICSKLTKNWFNNFRSHCSGIIFFLTLKKIDILKKFYPNDKYLVKAVILVSIYLFKVSNRKISINCEICWELVRKTTKRRRWWRSVARIVNFEQIPQIVHVIPLLTFNK